MISALKHGAFVIVGDTAPASVWRHLTAFPFHPQRRAYPISDHLLKRMA